ncbi:hypothetical protein K7X08_033800 [Anisodus acutangulus]|uniref:ATPase family AAA domain-containing protein 3 n=1 Tax=Anisodus acutangulus TaxID=402998 RepID=A0A9Q1M2R9_9SOLA|nr:hypothetical protein K7X08_033800 [Anisodus acutangulus]
MAAATSSTLPNRAYADAPFRLNEIPQTESSEDSKGGFNPESLERGAKALREINSSPYHKQVFDVMRKQEKTQLADIAAEKVHFEAIQAQADIDKQRKWGEDQQNLYQQQSQAKAQMLRYEDELARKRMQTDHEAQRRHNSELVKMQEESSVRKEQARRGTEEQIQAQQRQTEKERAEIERETIRVKAMAEAEGRAHEAKLTEDHKRRMLIERINGEREKWLAAINTTFSHVEEGFRILLTDRSKLIMTVGGVTALAAGVYTTREGARVTWGYINRILGQPSLIRDHPCQDFLGPQQTPSLTRHDFAICSFMVLLALGKQWSQGRSQENRVWTMAMMIGGDVAPLGAQAVTKIHEIFDWSKKSRKGLLLFIDEADAFLCERNSTYMSEAQRSALNALLFRTGDQSRDVVLVLATNRPGDLDSAVTDRIDEIIEFPLPQEDECFKLLKLYLNKYLIGEGDCDSNSKWGYFFKKSPQRITIKDLSDDAIREAAMKTEGFSDREIAKLMASVQVTVYGNPDCVLDSQLFKEIVDYKVVEHHQRIRLAAEGVEPTYQRN